MNTTIEELAAPGRVDLTWNRSGSDLLESNETESVTRDQRRDDRVGNACSRSKSLAEDTLEGIIGRSTARSALCKEA